MNIARQSFNPSGARIRQAVSWSLPLAAFRPALKTRANSLILGCLMAIGPMSTVAQSTTDQDAAKPDPVQLINQMSESLKTLNYRGVFVHMHNGNVETMEVLHAHDHKGIRERLISLNGEAREVYRNNKLVTCIWPGSESVILSQSKPRDLFPKVNQQFTQSEQYEFVMAAPDRVAGIESHVVDVRPRDAFRYGYRFWIDKSTGMLLRSVLMDNNDNPLEQLMFTQISYPSQFSEDDLEANADSRGGYTWVDNTHKPDTGENVSFAGLPGGYNKMSETYYPMPMNDKPYSHVMLSDGMASVSVYVEYLNAKTTADSGSAGVSSMGAVNAYGVEKDEVFITVVGEVPAETVKMIGNSVQLDSAKN